MEGSFSNPNGVVNKLVLDWLSSVVAQAGFSSAHSNLLEIYCGSGNHTVALAPFFGHVTAIELNRHLAGASLPLQLQPTMCGR